MSDTRRFQVVVREGPPHGDLYELEQTIYFDVVDTETEEVVLRFQGEMRAALSTSSGLWDNYDYAGVRDVALAPDGESVLVTAYGGGEEVVPIPKCPPDFRSHGDFGSPER